MPRINRSGFTVIELMITIAVIAILAVIAVPSFSDMLERNRIKGVAESVKTEFQYARSEAVKQSCENGTTLSFTGGNAWQLSLLRCDGTTRVFDSPIDGITLSEITFSDDNVAFNSRRGGSDESAGVFFSSDNYELMVRIVNERVIDVCYPADANAIAGFGEC